MENAPKITLEQIQAPIADRIRSYERYIASILHSDNAYVGSISDYILGNRGKQLRPLLVLLSAALHGEIGQRSYMGASLVEMIHTASLIHDDVVDEAYVRRGKPSVNALWHARTAVLIGDYIFARTYHACLQNKGWDMLTEVTRSIHEVSEGELIQTEQTEKLAMTREIYYDIIYKKTAALLGACGATGAISVGADEEHVNRMREFGNNLGVAFQIKDDILDYSPMEVTGKPTGGDMRERKITLPLLYVLEQSTPAERDLLLAKLSDVRNSPDHVEYLCRAVERGGGLDHARQCMAEYRDKALAFLEGYPDSDVLHSLRLFADFVLSRDK